MMSDIVLEEHELMWDDNGYLQQEENLVLLRHYSSIKNVIK